MKILLKILVCIFIIAALMALIILPGSAASLPITSTQHIDYGVSYCIVYRQSLARYIFLDVNTGTLMSGDELVTYNQDSDYFSDTYIESNNVYVDFYDDMLQMYIKIPLFLVGVDSNITYRCTSSVYQLPDEFEGALIFTVTARSQTLNSFINNIDTQVFSLVFDDRLVATTAPPYVLFALLDEDNKSFAYYDGMRNYTNELQNQYDSGYKAGQYDPVYSVSYEAGRIQGMAEAAANIPEDAPLGGMLHGLWTGFTLFIKTFFGQATIFNISLLGIVSSLLVIYVAYVFVKKVF